MSTLTNSILQGLGRINVPVINAGVALALQVVASVILLFHTDLDLYGLAIANILYSGVICFLNQFVLYKSIRYRQEWRKTFLLPGAAAVVMGGAARGVYELFYLLTESMRISLIPAVLMGVIVYFVALMALKAMSEEELRGLPKGYLLVKVAKKCRLL